jgi:putative transposase
MALPFKFHVGHTVVLIDDYGREARHYVREIKSDGWMFEPCGREGERLYHSGEAIRRQYLAARMRYEPWDDDAIPAARRRRLRESFSAQPRAIRVVAVRRLAILRACERAISNGMGVCATLDEVPTEVVAERLSAWQAEDTEAAKKIYDARELKGLLRAGEYFVAPKPFKAPCARTVWGWMQRYVESGRSINSLLDNHAGKGRRESQLSQAQDKELDTFFRDHVKKGGFERAAAFKQLGKILDGKGIPKIGRKTFNRRLKREHDRKGIAQLRTGVRASRRVGEISSRGPSPLFPLHQVEADHTLLNIKVVDDETGIDLGRPWLSVFKDRHSTVPLGLHQSFLAPSWATLSRAMAHSMWPKDLSGFPNVKNEWLAEGIFDEAYTDRGMDFISKAGRWAAAEMRCEILNLPGFSPWLKGSLERWNRDIKAEIMTYRDGITSFADPQYHGRNLPTVKVSELKAGLLEWIVDDYLCNNHSGRGGVPPNEIWREALDWHGPPRPVEDFDRFRRMTMIPKVRTIQNRGVEFDGFFYRDRDGELAELRKSHDAPREYRILVDPWDSGYIELLAGNRWLVLLNEYHELDGVSRYRSEFYWKHASEAHAGRQLTVDDFLRSREAVDADAQRVLALGKRLNKRGSQNALGRFLDLGQFITPVPLRQVRFRDPPVALPGLVERGGIIRPAARPDPTPAQAIYSATNSGGVVAPTPISPIAASTLVAPQGSSGAEGGAPGETTDIFARLAAGAKARARELHS